MQETAHLPLPMLLVPPQRRNSAGPVTGHGAWAGQRSAAQPKGASALYLMQVFPLVACSQSAPMRTERLCLAIVQTPARLLSCGTNANSLQLQPPLLPLCQS